MDERLELYLHGFSVLGSVLLILTLSRFLYGRVTGRALARELTTHDNPAVAIAFGGFTLACAATMTTLAQIRTGSMILDIQNILLFGAVGVALVFFSDTAHAAILHRGMGGRHEIYEGRNRAVAIAKAGALVGTGLTVAGCLSGEGGGISAVLIYFVLGQTVLSVVGLLHRKIAGYDVKAEIHSDNAAAGLSYAGTMTATGIILYYAGQGNFTDWRTDLSNYALFAGTGLILVPCLRWLFDIIWIPDAVMSHEIKHDKNWGVVLLEFALLQALATLFVMSFG